MDKIEILKLNVTRLRDLAMKEIEGIQGVHGMNKEQLHKILFGHFGIPLEEVTHIVKTPGLKTKIRETHKARIEAAHAGDEKKAKIIQKKLHDMKRITRQWTKAKVRARAKSKRGAA